MCATFRKISGYRVGLDRGYSSMQSSLRRNYFVTWYVIVIDVSCSKKKKKRIWAEYLLAVFVNDVF